MQHEPLAAPWEGTLAPSRPVGLVLAFLSVSASFHAGIVLGNEAFVIGNGLLEESV